MRNKPGLCISSCLQLTHPINLKKDADVSGLVVGSVVSKLEVFTSETVPLLAGGEVLLHWLESDPFPTLDKIMASRNIPRHKPPPGPSSAGFTGLHGQTAHAAAMAAGALFAGMSDVRAKTVLKEAVDAVVNSFAKHTHGYGRGKLS